MGIAPHLKRSWNRLVYRTAKRVTFAVDPLPLAPEELRFLLRMEQAGLRLVQRLREGEPTQ